MKCRNISENSFLQTFRAKISIGLKVLFYQFGWRWCSDVQCTDDAVVCRWCSGEQGILRMSRSQLIHKMILFTNLTSKTLHQSSVREGHLLVYKFPKLQIALIYGKLSYNSIFGKSWIELKSGYWQDNAIFFNSFSFRFCQFLTLFFG